MGLEAVELVVEVEETFGIKIADEEASGVRTPGQLCELILKKIEPNGLARRCASAHVFYELRRVMAKRLGLERRSLRPKTPLADVIPPSGRAQLWRDVERELGWSLPPLQHSGRVVIGVLAATVMLVAGMGWAIGMGWLSFWMVMPGVLLGGVALRLARPLARMRPPRETMGDLALATFGRNGRWMEEEMARLSRSDVWDLTVGIVAEVFGVNASEIRPEMDFVRDLGAD